MPLLFVSQLAFSQQPVISTFSPTYGPVGSLIVIKGKFFTGTTHVNFGNYASTAFSVNNDSVINATVGTGTTGSISVVTANGIATAPGFVATPVIDSFFPKSGKVGDTIVISGTNLNPQPAGNIVFFGPVKARVTNSSENMITAVVPQGAAYRPITVITNGLSVSTTLPFHPLFDNGTITENSFGAPLILTLPSLFPRGAATGDIDGDGKTDIVCVAIGVPYCKLILFKNTSADNKISFEKTGEIFVSQQIQRPTLCDFNCDGKLDILVRNSDVSVFKNISTPGSIAFADPVDLPNVAFFTDIAIPADINVDGKPDIITVNQQDSSVSIYRNISTPDSIAFANNINIRTLRLPYFICAQDLNDDKKPEIILTNARSFTSSKPPISVFENKSTGGINLLAQRVDFEAELSSLVMSHDLDSDGKSDILTTSVSSIVVYKNNSMPGGPVSLFPLKKINLPANTGGMSFGDYDGDGKADIALGINRSPGFTELAIQVNNSTDSNILLSTKQNYPLSIYGRNLSNADFDNDGRPDILFDYNDDYSMYIFRNRMGDNFSICAGSNITFLPNTRGSNYQWQVNTDTGFINVVNDSNYAGANDSVLILTAVPANWYGREFRCLIDMDTSNTYTLRFVSKWTGAVDSSWENPSNWNCGVIPDRYTDVEIDSGNVVVHSSVTIRSLAAKPGTIITITPPYNFSTLQ